METIKTAALWNGIELKDDDLDIPEKVGHERTTSVKDVEDGHTGNEMEKGGFMAIMSHPLLRRWSLNLYFNWAANAMVYYGLSLSASNLGDSISIYSSFVLLAIVEIPFVLAITVIMEKWGRRLPLAGSMIAAGILCLIPMFLAPHSKAIVVLGILGKGCIAASFALVYFFTAEIYPTVLRSSGVGLCSTFARIGGFLAPFVGDARFLFGGTTPLVICGIVSLMAGLLALDLPETNHKPLPETLNDVYKLARPSSKESRTRLITS